MKFSAFISLLLLLPLYHGVKASQIVLGNASANPQLISAYPEDTNRFSRRADTTELPRVDIFADGSSDSRILRTIEGVILTNGKKTQYLDLTKSEGNHATNNARELYARVPGLNIWESDAGGLQLGIGARGLSPSRTAHFNTRQNGYDISADPMGYPETYYTPPAAAIEGIQFIRGASGLQFGPQFGGMINFKLKEASKKPLSFRSVNTVGSWNLFNTFNAVSGTLRKKFSYNFYHQYKRGDGWRDNSGFSQHIAFGQLKFKFNEKLFVSAEHSFMTYTAQQAGGLTDQQFENDPRQSVRARNWFEVNWNISSVNLNWCPSSKTQVDLKGFRITATRNSLGNLDKISHADNQEKRDLISGQFNNAGAELRLLHKYRLFQKGIGALAAGARYYQGTAINQQGKGDSLSGPNFAFLNPSTLEGSDYRFPSRNIAAFAEQLFWINQKLSFSLGVRYENIRTEASGYYRETVLHPLTGVVIFDTTYTESSIRNRSVYLAGGGFSFRPGKAAEFYGNISQCYRPINFSDIRVLNPNEIVDPGMKDEKGWNADFGYRLQTRKASFDVSAFFLYYENKIGSALEKISDYEYQRVRKNLGLAYSTGIEFYGEKVWSVSDSSDISVSTFFSGSAVYAKYGKDVSPGVSDNWVELVPPLTLRSGIRVQYKNWRSSVGGSFVSRHYSDASNAVSDPAAVSAVIPTYYVLDFSTSIQLKSWIKLSGGINNFTNNHYFTRRASSYPGPGIIPSDAISFYLTVEFNF